MTAKQTIKLVKRWQARLALQEWDVRLHFDDKLDGAIAEVRYEFDYRRAHIAFDRQWRKQPNDFYAECIVVHELVHLLLVPIDFVSNELGGKQGKQYRRAMRNAEEQTVDRLALCFTRLART